MLFIVGFLQDCMTKIEELFEMQKHAFFLFNIIYP